MMREPEYTKIKACGEEAVPILLEAAWLKQHLSGESDDDIVAARTRSHPLDRGLPASQP
jgi:hypothetical protein